MFIVFWSCRVFSVWPSEMFQPLTVALVVANEKIDKFEWLW